MEIVLVVKCCNCLGSRTRSREVGFGSEKGVLVLYVRLWVKKAQNL